MKLCIAGSRPPEEFKYAPALYANWLLRLYLQLTREWEVNDYFRLTGVYNDPAFSPRDGGYLIADNCYLSAVSEFVSGCAAGADGLNDLFASRAYMYDQVSRNVRRFPADWKGKGTGAGMIRNADMADYLDALLLVWNGESSGSAHMKMETLRRCKPVYEIVIKDWRLGL